MSYRRSREIRINVYYIPIGVKSTDQIFGLFGNQKKYSDSVSRIWFINEESRNVTNSKLDWAVIFTTRYTRRNRKTAILVRDCANRQRPLPTYLTTTRDDIPGNGGRSTEAGQLGGRSTRRQVNSEAGQLGDRSTRRQVNLEAGQLGRSTEAGQLGAGLRKPTQTVKYVLTNTREPREP